MANLWTWYRAFERERHAFRRLEVTQVVSTFNIEFREAEASDVRTLAYIIEPRVVLFILATKLFSDLSSVDIALGSIDCLSKLFRRCRYMWISPFTETHVETVWYRSKLAQIKSFKMMARRNRHVRGSR